MTEEETRLEAEVERLLREGQETDEREDALYGPDRRGDELPEELARRESRLGKIREAKEALERKAREAGLKRKPRDPDAGPDAKAQGNFTDPDSRIMPSSTDKGSFLQGYNCQAAVDQEHQVILAEEVTQQTNDAGQAVPMLEAVVENTGALPEKASADQAGEGGLPETQGDRRTRFRSDQARPRVQAVPFARVGEGPCRVVVDLHGPQPAQALAGQRRRVRRCWPRRPPDSPKAARLRERAGRFRPAAALRSPQIRPVSSARAPCLGSKSPGQNARY